MSDLRERLVHEIIGSFMSGPEYSVKSAGQLADRILSLFTEELRKAFYDCHRWEADRRLESITTGDYEAKEEAKKRYVE